MPHFNSVPWREACKYVCWCVFVCAPVHVDELDTEKIAFFFNTVSQSQRARKRVHTSKDMALTPSQWLKKA